MEHISGSFSFSYETPVTTFYLYGSFTADPDSDKHLLNFPPNVIYVTLFKREFADGFHELPIARKFYIIEKDGHYTFCHLKNQTFITLETEQARLVMRAVLESYKEAIELRDKRANEPDQDISDLLDLLN